MNTPANPSFTIILMSGHPQYLWDDKFDCCTERFEIVVYRYSLEISVLEIREILLTRQRKPKEDGDGLYLMLKELVAQPLCTKKTIKYV